MLEAETKARVVAVPAEAEERRALMREEMKLKMELLREESATRQEALREENTARLEVMRDTIKVARAESEVSGESAKGAQKRKRVSRAVRELL
jgi:hypothetical protein